MKILGFVSVIMLYILSNIVSASETCPNRIDLSKKSYTAPSGWHITANIIEPKAKELVFLIATFNFDHKIGVNNNHISCYYKDRYNTSNFEITTDNTISKTEGPNWLKLDNVTTYCFPSKPIDPTTCPWTSAK